MKSWYASIAGILFASFVVFFWYHSVPDAPVFSPLAPEKHLQTIVREGDTYIPKPYDPNIVESYTVYHTHAFSVYGRGSSRNALDTLTFVDGQWFIVISDPSRVYPFVSGDISGQITLPGTIFIDLDATSLLNFDTKVLVDSVSIPPLFRLQGGELGFVDTVRMDMVDAGLWDMYRTLVNAYIYAPQEVNVSTLYSHIDMMLAREPRVQSDGLARDMRPRRVLEELREVLRSLVEGASCGLSARDCYDALEAVLARGDVLSIDGFGDLGREIRSWLVTEKGIVDMTWHGIFRAYHRGLIIGDPTALAQRDKSLLQLIRSGEAPPSPDVWQYLHAILSYETIGSIYSIQMMNEMIRVGDALSRAGSLDAAMTEQARVLLTKLRDVLEKTYFTKQSYFYVLRTDIVTESGDSLDPSLMTTDMSRLIQSLDISTLFQSYPDFQTVRGQLTWFSCIFANNTAYLDNPRVCRTRK